MWAHFDRIERGDMILGLILFATALGLLPQWSFLGQQRRHSKSHPGASLSGDRATGDK